MTIRFARPLGMVLVLGACACAGTGTGTPAAPVQPLQKEPSRKQAEEGLTLDWVLGVSRAQANAGDWEAALLLLEAARKVAPEPRVPAVIVQEAEMLRFLERYDEADARYAEARAAAAKAGDDHARARALHGLGEIRYVKARYFYDGDIAPAFGPLEEARSLWERLGDGAQLSLTLYRLGTLHEAAAEAPGAAADHEQRAQALFQRAREAAERAGAKQELAYALTHLAGGATGRGQAEEALRLDERALAIAKELGNRRDMAFYMTNVAEDHAALGHAREAEALLAQSLAVAERIRLRLAIARTHMSLAALHGRRHEPVRELEHYEKAIAAAGEVGYKIMLRHALLAAARLYQARRQMPEAQRALLRVAEIVERAGFADARAALSADLAWVHAAAARSAEARGAVQAWLAAGRAGAKAGAGADEKARIHLAVALLLEAKDAGAGELAAGLGLAASASVVSERAVALAGEAGDGKLLAAALIEQGRHQAVARQSPKAAASLRQARDKAAAENLPELAAYAAEVAKRHQIAL